MTTVVPHQPATCPHCGMIHQTTCPRIKSIEYENGMVKKIEFHALGEARQNLPAWVRELPYK